MIFSNVPFKIYYNIELFASQFDSNGRVETCRSCPTCRVVDRCLVTVMARVCVTILGQYLASCYLNTIGSYGRVMVGRQLQRFAGHDSSGCQEGVVH